MNDIDLLRRMRDDLPPPDGAALARGRARLVAEALGAPMAATAIARPPLRLGWRFATAAGPTTAIARSPLRLGWRFAAAAGLTLVLAAGVAVTMTRTSSEDPGGSAAALVLRRAALTAEHEPLLAARPDQYVYVESIFVNTPNRRMDNRAFQDETQRAWTSVDGSRDGLVRGEPRSGSGRKTEAPIEGCSTVTGVTGGTELSRGKQSVTCTPVPGYRDDLPTSADAMLTYLRQQMAMSEAGVDEFIVAASLIQRAYVPPASLAALFQALTRVPAITVAKGVTDAAGRAGVSVGVGVGEGRRELIFNPQTYAYLGYRATAVRFPGAPKTTEAPSRQDVPSRQSAYLRVAIVDRVGQLP
jgi:hypothetical protein